MTNQNPMTLPVYSDQAISRMFCDYVDSTNCKERHTAAAVRDYDVFADYVENETRSSNTVQNALLEKAMDKISFSISNSLRMRDVYTRYSRSQYLLLLLDADKSSFDGIEERIMTRFRRSKTMDSVNVKFDFKEI